MEQAEQDDPPTDDSGSSTSASKRQKTKKHQARREYETTYPVYTDYAALPSPPSVDASLSVNKAARRGGAKVTFPAKLHGMLDYALTVMGMSEEAVIGWLPHGRAFVVRDKDRFVRDMLPLFFKFQKQYASFQRQLNMYGFLRLTKAGSPDQNGYYHELFLRGRPDWIPHLGPKKPPKDACANNTVAHHNTVRRAIDPATEPDLHSFPHCYGGTGRSSPDTDEQEQQHCEATALVVPLSNSSSNSFVAREASVSTSDNTDNTTIWAVSKANDSVPTALVDFDPLSVNLASQQDVLHLGYQQQHTYRYGTTETATKTTGRLLDVETVLPNDDFFTGNNIDIIIGHYNVWDNALSMIHPTTTTTTPVAQLQFSGTIHARSSSSTSITRSSSQVVHVPPPPSHYLETDDVDFMFELFAEEDRLPGNQQLPPVHDDGVLQLLQLQLPHAEEEEDCPTPAAGNQQQLPPPHGKVVHTLGPQQQQLQPPLPLLQPPPSDPLASCLYESPATTSSKSSYDLRSGWLPDRRGDNISSSSNKRLNHPRVFSDLNPSEIASNEFSDIASTADKHCRNDKELERLVDAIFCDSSLSSST